MFPDANAENLAICLPPPGAMAPAFSVLMVNTLADMGIFWGGTQILSQYLYEKPTESGVTLFSSSDDVGVRDNITDGFLEFCRTAFDETVTKDSIFYYVYGMLHSAEYRATFEADLRKEGPRISLVKQEQDFWAFSQAGRDLADLHVNYEEVEPWPSLEISYKEGFNSESPDAFRIEKMRYPKIDDPENPGKKIDDSTTVIYNSNITISGIPESAHKYRIGSQSAVDWIIDRYRIRTHKDSGIVNDPNDWAVEHDDPTYILDLLQRIVTVSMKTNEIVAGLPKLKF